MESTTSDAHRIQSWLDMLEGAGVHAWDRVLVALPATRPIAADAQLALSKSGVQSTTRDAVSLRTLLEQAPSVLIATPGTVLRVTREALHDRLEVRDTPLRLVVLTGEPGGSLDATRRIIQDSWAARCLDVYAMRELGVLGWSCNERQGGIHLDDREFRFEVCVPDSEQPASSDELGELVAISPGATYRTGDLFRLESGECACGRSPLWAAGGVHGRTRDLMRIRGQALLPSTIEQIVRRHPAVLDVRLRIYHVRGECEVAVELETSEAIASESARSRVATEVAEDLRRCIGFRLPCDVFPSARAGQE